MNKRERGRTLIDTTGISNGVPSGPNFESLVDRYCRSPYQFAYSFTRSDADATDLAPQTFYLWAEKG